MLDPPEPWTRHEDGTVTIDAEYVRPGFASVHVIERDGRVAIIDTGANSAAPLVLQALHQLGLDPQTVDLLFLTHVHLDHAGGTGTLIQQLPHARVLVHPRGAPHIVDPTRLQAATIAVYGQAAFEQLYGQLVPVAADRVDRTEDGQTVRLGQRELTILHTPGHAMHHQVLYDSQARVLFSGDTFGVSYRAFDTNAGAFIVPTTTPTQFDPDQLSDSVRRIAALDPKAVYLTHYGRVTGVSRLAAALREQIESCVRIGREHAQTENPFARIRAALRDDMVARASAHGIEDAPSAVEAVLGNDLNLNAHGVVAWLERTSKRSRA